MALKSISFNIDDVLTPKQIEAKNKLIGKVIGNLLLTLTMP